MIGTKDQDIPQLPFKRIIDLDGQTVLPAFGDAHIHSLWIIRRFFEADLSHTHSLNEVLQTLKTFARNNSGDWLIGRGFNRNLWPQKTAHRKFLDRLFPDRPVFLEAQDCHSAWVNTEALHRCGIRSATPDPPGGRIEKDPSGQPTGLLYEQAVRLVSKFIPPPDLKSMENGAERLIRHLHALGITTVHTMEDLSAFAFWQSYFDRHPRTLRLTFYFQLDDLPTLLKARLRSGFGNDWLNIGGLKLFADGSLGSQTALLSRPYEQDPTSFGIERIPAPELEKIITEAQCHGLAVAVHAIGDRAVDSVLKALKHTEEYRKKYGLLSRIEHAQLIRPDLLPLFAQYGLVTSMQPIHIADDVPTAQRYWGTRSRWAYAFRSLLTTGVPLAFGSDAPVAPLDPWKGIFSAVNRRFRLSNKEPAWYPQESLNVEEAVQAFTAGVALASNRLRTAGTLEPGKNADFIVINKDPFRLEANQLLSIRVKKTFLAGQQVYPSL